MYCFLFLHQYFFCLLFSLYKTWFLTFLSSSTKRYIWLPIDSVIVSLLFSDCGIPARQCHTPASLSARLSSTFPFCLGYPPLVRTPSSAFSHPLRSLHTCNHRSCLRAYSAGGKSDIEQFILCGL